MRKLWTSAAIAVAVLGSAASALADPVIIKCRRPCTAVVDTVQRNGGVVTYQYKYVDAIAAEIDRVSLASVRRLLGPGAVRKDVIVQLPSAGAGTRRGMSAAATLEAAIEGASLLEAEAVAAEAAANPDAYLINNASLNLGGLQAAGRLGQGMKVAVIDSGIRPGFPHISLDNSVIGGEDFVPDPAGFSHPDNNGHGTFVAGMISAAVVFGIGSPLRDVIASYCPTCVLPTGNPAVSALPVIGSAPASSIYALKVFPSVGGAPTSRIIAAMERVLELREKFDNGQAETADASGRFQALNIKVCNMSLGGPTLFAGRDIEDQLTEAFLARDIVLLVSAGNAGPSGATGGSPGTGFGALTVGASSSPVHERILRDLQLGIGAGAIFRPFDGVQTAFFSSRGPTADGRVDPEVVANGFASFGQGFGAVNSFDIASGTSFSSPTVAGVAAVLRQAVPAATAREVRNAIIMSANPAFVTDGSGPLDRGAGYVDAAAAVALLETWTTPDTPGEEGLTNHHVRNNIEHGTDVEVFHGAVTRSVRGLKPGQRFETFLRVEKDVSAVVVTLSGVIPGSPQNLAFGDDILLTVHSAKTSEVPADDGSDGDYRVFAFTTGGTFTIPNPDIGLMRITLNGDWTNASPIAATVDITPISADFSGKSSAQDKLEEGQFKVYTFTVPPGTATLSARLVWDGDWGNYPTNDLDLLLFTPSGELNVEAATLDVPERVAILKPAAGTWTAIVDGFTINTKDDQFKLNLLIDGKLLRLK